ncbi:flagellar hook-length control protein FliK [Sphingomonas aurantiaca]
MTDTILACDLATALDAWPDLRVLSLDCFDTLLWRDTHAPQDVFGALGAPNPQQRVWAEQRARGTAALRRRRNEVGIAEIYAELAPNATAEARAAMVAHELATEARHCFGFAPVIALMQAARARGLMGASLSPPLTGVAVRAGAWADVTVAEAFASALDGILATTDMVPAARGGAVPDAGVPSAAPVAEASVSAPWSGRVTRSEVTVSEPAEPRVDGPSATLGAADLVVLRATPSVPAATSPRGGIDVTIAAPDIPEPAGAPRPSETPAPLQAAVRRGRAAERAQAHENAPPTALAAAASTSTPATTRASTKTAPPDTAAPAPAPALVGIVPAAGPSAAPLASATPVGKPSPVAPLSSDAAAEFPRSDITQSAIDAIALVTPDTPSAAAPASVSGASATMSAVRVDGPVIGPVVPEVQPVVDAGINAVPDHHSVADVAASPRDRPPLTRPSPLNEKPAMHEQAEGGPNIAVAQTVPTAQANGVTPGPTHMSHPPKLRADDRAIVDRSGEDDASPMTNAGPANGSMLPIPTAPTLDPGPPWVVSLSGASVPPPVAVEAAPALRPSVPEAPLPGVISGPRALPVTETRPGAQPAETPSIAPEPARRTRTLAAAVRPEIAEAPSRGPVPGESGQPVARAYPVDAVGGAAVRSRAGGPRSVPGETLDIGARASVLPSTLAAQVIPVGPILEPRPAVVAGPVALADRGVADDAAIPLRGAPPAPPRAAQRASVAPPQVPEDAALPTSLARASIGGVGAGSLMSPGIGPAEPMQSAESAASAEPTEVAEPTAVSAAPVRVDLAMVSAGTVQGSWSGPAGVAPVVVSRQAEGSNDARASRSIAPARDSSSTASRPFAAPSNPVGARRPDGPREAGDPTAPDVRAQDPDAVRMAKPKTKGVVLADAGSDHMAKIQPDAFVAPQAADPVSAASAPSRAMAPPPVARQAVADMPVVVAQPGRIGQEMGVAIVHRLSAGEEELVVRLEPAALGRIEVRMAFDDQGGLRAVIAADSPVALDMLRRDSADLSRALNDAGIRNDGQSLRFQADGNGGGNAGGQPRNPWMSGDRATDRSTTDRGVSDDPLPYRQVRLGGRYDLMA